MLSSHQMRIVYPAHNRRVLVRELSAADSHVQPNPSTHTGDSTMADNAIQGLHHITLCTGTAQGDVDFFVKVLGQRFIKRTLFYDGREPIYHLYFTDGAGTPGTVMTTFPTRRTGLKGRKGSGQFTAIAYSVPRGALGFWAERLGGQGYKPRRPDGF